MLFHLRGHAGTRELDFLSGHVEAISHIEHLAESIARQLGAWAASQRNGDIEGSRYLPAHEKERREQAGSRSAFLEQIKRLADISASGNAGI